MPKSREQKAVLLDSYSHQLDSAQSVTFVSLQGVKVDDIEAMRDAFYPLGVQFQAAKNSLLKKVLAELSLEVPAELLDQPVALVYAHQDPVSGPKALVPFLKDVPALTILGGLLDGVYMTAAQMDALGKLPSREQLLGQLVGTLNAPISGFVNVLAGNIRGLVTALGQIRDQKAEAGA